MIRRPPRSPLFPSTTFFRSAVARAAWHMGAEDARRPPHRRVEAGLLVDLAHQRRPRVLPVVDPAARQGPQLGAGDAGSERSEEHTSELQSRQYLVCRLLLEK